MKHLSRFLSTALFVTAITTLTTYSSQDCQTENDCTGCASPFYLPRPQGSNSAYFNSYSYDYNRCCANIDSNYTIGFRFNQTFNGKNIANCVLGCNALTFVGFGDYQYSVDQSVPRGSQFIRADDFGLSPFYKGTITFNPRIRNYNVDFSGRWELGCLDDCLEHFFVGVNTTLTHTCWEWRHECCKTAPSNLVLAPNLLTLAIDIMFPLGEMSEYRNFDGFKSIPEALQAERGFGGDGFSTYGVLGPMRYGRFILDRPAKATALANVDAIVGYDFYRCDCSHFSAFIRTSAPTGTQIYSKTILEPVIGNGHHWELGGGIDARGDLWQCDNASLTTYLTGNLTHLFRDGQTRIIPLVQGCCLSQYTLLKEYDKNGLLIPGIVRGTDVAARHVKSSFALQGDATLGFMYRNCNWAFNTGLNVFGRSREKLEDIRPTVDLDKRIFGIKGRTPVFAPIPAQVGLYIASTSSTYCITDSNNANTPIDGTPTPVDNSTDWYTGDPALQAVPTYLNLATICKLRGVPRLVTYKLFGAIDYQHEEGDRQAFMGIGGEVEFASNRNCKVCAANQWGIWIRGGLGF